MNDLDDLERDLERNAVGLDPVSIAAAISALVGLIANCRNKAPAAAAITGRPGIAEKTLLRNAIRRELRDRGERVTPERVQSCLTSLLDAQQRADAASRAAVADHLTKWELA
jgi:hypothetical protein